MESIPILIIWRIGEIMRNDILNREKDIRLWIKDNTPKAEIARRLNCKIDTLNTYLTKMGILYNGNIGGKGTKKPKKISRYIPFVEYIKSDSVQSNKLRKKLLRERLKKYECESCGKSKWLEKAIPLEVHHKDGDKRNNEIDNLQLLCPNCHALTDNYRGKNIGKYGSMAE